MHDYLIVGSGFFGSICARHLHDQGKKVVVIEKRNHIGGNCYTEVKSGITVHTYGPHIFHTNNREVWDWINQYAEFKPIRLQVMATAKDKVYSLPFSMHTFNQVYGATNPEEAMLCIDQHSECADDGSLESAAIKKVGRKVYELLIKLLDGIEVMLNTDFFSDPIPPARDIIYTGPIDKFFDYQFGSLEYKTIRHKHEWVFSSNVQGCPVMNYTDADIPYTRKIEQRPTHTTQLTTRPTTRSIKPTKNWPIQLRMFTLEEGLANIDILTCTKLLKKPLISARKHYNEETLQSPYDRGWGELDWNWHRSTDDISHTDASSVLRG